MPWWGSFPWRGRWWRIPRSPVFMQGLQQVAERTEMQVEVAFLELEMLGQLAHTAIEEHERLAQPLDLVVRQRPGLHPPQRLALHQLAQQLDQRQDELGEAFLDLLRIGVDSARKRLRQVVELAGDAAQVAVGLEQLPGEHVA